MFRAVCKAATKVDGRFIACEFETDDPAALVAHYKDVHRRRQYHGDPLVKRTRAGWKTPTHRAFEPGRFDVGTFVTWRDSKGTHTGQVWAQHGPRSRWVADGAEYHVVYADQLLDEVATAAA